MRFHSKLELTPLPLALRYERGYPQNTLSGLKTVGFLLILVHFLLCFLLCILCFILYFIFKTRFKASFEVPTTRFGVTAKCERQWKREVSVK